LDNDDALRCVRRRKLWRSVEWLINADNNVPTLHHEQQQQQQPATTTTTTTTVENDGVSTASSNIESLNASQRALMLAHSARCAYEINLIFVSIHSLTS
jgi:hypothetical protein